MTDPRNIAHDKKVQQEKKHHDQEVAPGADKKRMTPPDALPQEARRVQTRVFTAFKAGK